MADATTTTVPEGTDGPLHVRADRPVDVHFSFERPQSSLGAWASVGTHIALLVIAVLVSRYQPERAPVEIPPPTPLDRIIWIAEPGPGGGGGGGGNKSPDPPRKIEMPGKEAITVPVAPRPTPAPPKIEKPEPEPPPLEPLNIPAVNMAAAEQMLPGTIQSESTAAPASASQGSGSGGGAGTDSGTGIGPGQGSGLGDGRGGGTGGGAYRPGAGITVPRVLQEARPNYTADAMRAKIQGSVYLECIVMPDGTVGDVRVTKSLDPIFGLDQEAIKAAKRWRFTPGMRQGEPVPVLITIELTFTLR